MHPHESPLYEGALPGVFVHHSIIQELDARLSVLFVTVESVRHYLAETDDGSLQWQLLRRALNEGFFNLLQALDRAGLLDDCSQYPYEMRSTRAKANEREPAISHEPTPQEHLNRPYSSAVLAELERVGAMLLKNYLLGRELEDNEERRKELLRLGGSSGSDGGQEQ